MRSGQVQDKLAVQDFRLRQSRQASARRMFPILKHLFGKASPLIADERVQLGRVLVYLFLEKLFGLGLGAIGIKKAHSEKVLLRIGYLTGKGPYLTILDGETGKYLKRGVSLILA
jgi:hypothetical protein